MWKGVQSNGPHLGKACNSVLSKDMVVDPVRALREVEILRDEVGSSEGLALRDVHVFDLVIAGRQVVPLQHCGVIGLYCRPAFCPFSAALCSVEVIVI